MLLVYCNQYASSRIVSCHILLLYDVSLDTSLNILSLDLDRERGRVFLCRIDQARSEHGVVG